MSATKKKKIQLERIEYKLNTKYQVYVKEIPNMKRHNHFASKRYLF